MAESNPQAVQAAQAEVVESDSVLERILTEGKLGQTAEEKNEAREWVRALVRDVVTEKMKVSADVLVMISARIAALDEAITGQINEIMHAPEFKKLEAAWRGLNYLVMQSETGSMLKLKV